MFLKLRSREIADLSKLWSGADLIATRHVNFSVVTGRLYGKLRKIMPSGS